MLQPPAHGPLSSDVKTLLFVLTVFVLLLQRQYALPEPLMMALAGGGIMGFAALVRRSLSAQPPAEALQPREILVEAGRQLAGHARRARRRAMHA